MSVSASVDTSILESHADAQSRRRDRIAARYTLWQLSDLSRVRSCGRWASDKDAGVAVKVSGSVADGTRTAGLGGTVTCGSVWACPVCAAKIQAERNLQVAAALAAARARGLEVMFLTLTMRHKRDHRIGMLWDHLSDAWRACTSGSEGVPYVSPKTGRMCKGSKGDGWKQDRELYGVAGYLRLVEVTHGENGWHVHVHALLFLDPSSSVLHGPVSTGRFTDEELEGLAERFWVRWSRALDVAKGIRPGRKHGVDWKRVRSDDAMADYFAKGLYSKLDTRKGEASTAADVTLSSSKATKHGNRTPFQILAGLVAIETGEVGPDFERDLELWNSFEAASQDRRQLVWSRGLRQLLELEDAERTDLEIAEDDELKGETLLHLESDVFRWVAGRRMVADLLEMVEADDTGELVRRWLDTLAPPPRSSS